MKTTSELPNPWLPIIYTIHYQGWWNRLWNGKMKLRYNADFNFWMVVN